MVGTFLGLALAVVLFAVDPAGLGLILVVAALQVAAELPVGRNYAVALVAVTPLALLMVHLVAPVPSADLLRDRGVETVIGVVAGLGVGYLTRRGDGVAGSGRRPRPGWVRARARAGSGSG